MGPRRNLLHCSARAARTAKSGYSRRSRCHLEQYVYRGLKGFGAVPVNAALVERTDANIDFSAVPEPACHSLLGIGLAGFGAMRRRRGS